jgi:hypothetical protein
MKKCSKCQLEKSEKCFGKHKLTKSGLYPSCKDCRQRYRKENKEFLKKKNHEYYERAKNSEKFISRTKEYYKNNKDVILNRSVKRYIENKDHCLMVAAKRLRIRRNSDPIFKLKTNMRRMILRIIKGKSQRSIYYLGVSSIEEFINLMNFKTDNPKWLEDRYHLDHIWQIHWFSDFLLKDKEKACLLINHYSNLRPLSPKENLKRNKKNFEPLLFEDFLKYKEFLNSDILNEIQNYKGWNMSLV